MKYFIFFIIYISFCQNTFCQHIIHGRVLDNSNEGIPGVHINEKGNILNRTITDIDGFFKITVKDSLAILQVSYMGYTGAEVKAHNYTEQYYVSRNKFISISIDLDSALTIPDFKFPPHPASATDIIDKSFFTTAKFLRDVSDRILVTLKQQGYTENRFFSIPNGFAITTPIEKINSKGISRPATERYELWHFPRRKFSLNDYLDALIFGYKGTYRVFVFIVTDVDFSNSGPILSEKKAAAWSHTGFNTLPSYLGNKRYSSRYSVHVLVYEFLKKESNSIPEFVGRSNLTGNEHLIKARLFH